MKIHADFNLTIPKTSHKWSILSNLWQDNTVCFDTTDKGWVISEKDYFSMRRDFVTNRRFTDIDKYGLLGISLLNLDNDSVIITEGVSDFFTTKLCNPSENVLGVTNIGGSTFAKHFLVSVFKSVTVVADNDITGMQNAARWKQLFSKYNIKTSIWQPERKDITEDFLINLRLHL